MNQPERRDRGYALVIVLIVLVALSLMLGANLTTAHQFADQMHARTVSLRLRAAVDGSFVTIIHRLKTGIISVAYGAPQTIRVGGTDVTVIIRPESSKLDMNYASRDDIERLLRASRLSNGYARDVAARLVSSRSGSKQTENSQGLGQEDLLARPFETFSDIALASRAGTDLTDCLRSDITLFARSREVDGAAASERLKKALSIESEEIDGAGPGASAVGGLAGLTDVFEFTAVAKDDASQIEFHRQIIFRLYGDSTNPYTVLSQSDGAPDPQASWDACARLAAHAR